MHSALTSLLRYTCPLLYITIMPCLVTALIYMSVRLKKRGWGGGGVGFVKFRKIRNIKDLIKF